MLSPNYVIIEGDVLEDFNYICTYIIICAYIIIYYNFTFTLKAKLKSWFNINIMLQWAKKIIKDSLVEFWNNFILK